MDGTKNVMGMRWIIQRELGGTIVYFHQVELPPGAVEGTHQHVGSEELYYFIEGEGLPISATAMILTWTRSTR